MVADIATADSNLLVNGSFEATALGVGKAAGFQSIAGWTALTGGTIELWNAVIGVTATQGVNFAELDYLGGYDGFYQDVGTTAGQAYTLSFDLRSRPGYAISTQGVEVVWNGQVVATTYARHRLEHVQRQRERHGGTGPPHHPRSAGPERRRHRRPAGQFPLNVQPAAGRPGLRRSRACFGH